jgi:hypothetical protein
LLGRLLKVSDHNSGGRLGEESIEGGRSELLIESIAGKEHQISGHSLADFFLTPSVKKYDSRLGVSVPPLIPDLGWISLTIEAYTAFRPLAGRGCVRRAAAERGRPEGDVVCGG